MVPRASSNLLCFALLALGAFGHYLGTRTVNDAYTGVQIRQEAPTPTCVNDCYSVFGQNNVLGYSDCFAKGAAQSDILPNYIADCSCFYLSYCYGFCTVDPGIQQYIGLRERSCNSNTFSGLTWGWVSFPTNTATNPSTFYDRYPGISGVVVVPAATSTDALPKSATVTPESTQATPPSNASEALDYIRSGHPRCAEEITSSCPNLFEGTMGCWNAASPQYCFCQFLAKISCQSICLNQTQPRAYLSWIKKTCGSLSNITIPTEQNPENVTVDVFSIDWQDFKQFQDLAREDLFPWKWRVAQNMSQLPPNSAPTECPSRASKLGSFAIVNLLSFFASIILGRRTVMAWITRGFFGTLGSPWWPLTALLTTGLLIGVTFINARIIHSTPGFGSTPINQLALLWFCRPRLSWVSILLVKADWEEGMYVSMGASAILSEVVLQALALFYMGLTVDFGRANGYYRVGAIEGIVVPWGKPAHMMYGGALLWMTGIGFVILWVLATFLGLGTLVKTLFSYLFGRFSHLTGSTRVTIDGVGEDISSGWSALGSSMKESFHRGIFQHFSRRLPHPVEMIQIIETQAKAVPSNRVPEQDPEQRDSINIENGHHPRQQNIFNEGALGITEGNPEADSLYEWLYKMGLSPKSLDRIVTVFFWMVLPFIGQWLFWVGFVDLAEDLYCPPKLGTITTIWVLAAVLSILLRSSL